jgi:hypothetical protein
MSNERGREFFTKIVGVSKANADGSDRQQLIGQSEAGQFLDAVRERNNVHDRKAIAVCDRRGRQFGYLSREVAQELAGLMDRGHHQVRVRITEITGGTSDRPTLGVNVRIEVVDGEAPAGLQPLPNDEATIRISGTFIVIALVIILLGCLMIWAAQSR